MLLRRFIHSHIRKMATLSIPDVDIDDNGVFKYILIQLTTGAKGGEVKTRDIVRGYADCGFHADIDDKVDEVLKKLKKSGELESFMKKVLGGGRIDHNADTKKIKVYGYSQGFGKADHSVAVALLKTAYPNYEITWSDEGY